MAGTTRLNVLGPFEAQRPDGTSVRLGAKAQALLGYLAVERARPATRDHLATMLWGEQPEERARHNLRQALSRIRRECGEVLATDGASVALDPAACTVDVEALEHHLDDGAFGAALELYRDDLLAGLAVDEPGFDDWLRHARSRLRDASCRAMERLADRHAEAGDHEQAMALYRRRLAVDPACERAHLGLMRLLARSGRRSDALRQYELCFEAMETELGALPGPETVAEYEQIRDAPEPDAACADPPALSRTAHSPVPDAHEPPSVAVLPFENMAGPDDDYFVDGITEDVIMALSRFSSLLVIARASTFAHRDAELSEAQIAEDVGAQFLVRGSVRRAERRVRIGVQLLDAATGRHLWAQRYDREAEDVFLVQDEVSETVVSTLAGRVEAARIARARRAPEERLDAYDYVLRGKDLHHRYTPDDCEAAIAMFEQAIEHDPDFAIAHAWLACGLGQALVFRPADTAALVDRAQAAAERGLELDDNESECHRILAQVFLIRRDPHRSLPYQERAVALNPSDDRSVCAMGEILSFIGRPEEAEGWVRRAMRLNPYHPEAYWTHLGRSLFHMGNLPGAQAAFGAITRPRVRDLAYAAAAAERAGDSASRDAAVERLRAADPDFDADRFVDGLPYGHEPHREDLRQALSAALA